jgi:hypothetical protein
MSIYATLWAGQNYQVITQPSLTESWFLNPIAGKSYF